MSVTISNCDEIAKSPTNTSPSKQLYTFPKTARFNSRRLVMYLLPSFRCDKYYELPSSVNGGRTTSLGFGHKYDFTHEYTISDSVLPKIPLPTPTMFLVSSHPIKRWVTASEKEENKCR